MLEIVLDLFEKKFKEKLVAWDNFIEFLAVDNSGDIFFQLNHKFEWLFKDQKFVKELMSIYNSTLLRSDYYDHLGDLYYEKILKKSEKQREEYLHLKMKEINAILKMTINYRNAPLKIIDSSAGTGRYLMAVHEIAPKYALLGVDNDIRAIRIAITNFAIHEIQGLLLYAEKEIHDIDLNTDEGIHNWQYANKWYSNMNKLKNPVQKI